MLQKARRISLLLVLRAYDFDWIDTQNSRSGRPCGANSNQQQIAPAPQANNTAAPVSEGRREGSIISINESNNFVIVDLGQENSSVGVGNALKVYRNSNEIATLEVIQVRRDICAADIKDKSDELKVGDVVKFN